MSAQRVCLDHVSASPLRPVARTALLDTLDRGIADPGRTYSEALEARALLEDARSTVATALGARSREVVFTSGRVESTASVVHGVGGRQIASLVEHAAIRDNVEPIGELVGCDPVGRVRVGDIEGAVTESTTLVHVQWANHEVGTRQRVDEVVELVHARGAMVHIDATVAVGHDTVSFSDSGADFLTCDATGFGGPPGVGVFLIRRGLRIDPLLVGGDQERARRAGLENVPGACAAAAALAEAVSELEPAAATERRFTDALVGIGTAVPDVEVLGDPVDRVPHLVCLAVGGIEPQAVVIGLDRRGIAAHSGNSCSSESLEPSPVLEAMGVDAHRSLRLSVGWTTTDADIDAFADAFAPTIEELRSLGR